MFSGFNLQFTKNLSQHYHEVGMKMFNREEGRIKQTLNKYLIENKMIDATKLKDDWFPQIPADIFLSHSHQDEKMAIKLAGYLKLNFDLEVFIDSCVWGYVGELQKEVDDTHVTKTPNGSGGYTYNYRERNYSTSHVNMLLASALKSMIDKTECVIFLNSSNSITSIFSDDVRHGTLSPWIYYELDTVSTIRRKLPNRLLKKAMTDGLYKFGEVNKPPLQVFYDVNLESLVDLNEDNLESWREKRSTKSQALDDLYELMNIKTTPNMPMYG